jgi:hypothetical protein
MPRKDALDRMIEAAVAKWKQTVGPTPAAVAGYEAVRGLLAKSARGGLKATVQKFPPKYVLSLPAKKRGGHVWEFASVAAVEGDVYFDLSPLGLDVSLRNRVGPALRKRGYRPDDGYRLPGGGTKFLPELADLIAAADDWFRREVIPARPLPPCQPIDHYLIEPAGKFVPRYEPLGEATRLLPRLTAAFGKGTWVRAVATARIELPGWAKPCEAELHRYTRRAKSDRVEAWKIKRYGKGAPAARPCGAELVYAAASDFRASLHPGRAYRCTATLGKRFTAYVRVADESGEEYWYPERWFVPRS